MLHFGIGKRGRIFVEKLLGTAGWFNCLAVVKKCSSNKMVHFTLEQAPFTFEVLRYPVPVHLATKSGPGGNGGFTNGRVCVMGGKRNCPLKQLQSEAVIC